MSEDSTCKRCGKRGHTGRACKATWRKSWPGQPAMRLGIKHADGSSMELTIVLTESGYAQAIALFEQAIKDSPKGSAEPESEA